MEDLLWKYIDNQCTEEEVLQIQKLLDNDLDFKILYLQYLETDTLMKQNIMLTLPENLSRKLEFAITEKTVNVAATRKVDLFDIQWIAIAIFIIGGLTAAYFTKGNATTSDVPLIEQILVYFKRDTLQIFNIVVISVATLISLDSLLKYMTKLRSAVLL